MRFTRWNTFYRIETYKHMYPYTTFFSLVLYIELNVWVVNKLCVFKWTGIILKLACLQVCSLPQKTTTEFNARLKLVLSVGWAVVFSGNFSDFPLCKFFNLNSNAGHNLFFHSISRYNYMKNAFKLSLLSHFYWTGHSSKLKIEFLFL